MAGSETAEGVLILQRILEANMSIKKRVQHANFCAAYFKKLDTVASAQFGLTNVEGAERKRRMKQPKAHQQTSVMRTM